MINRDFEFLLEPNFKRLQEYFGHILDLRVYLDLQDKDHNFDDVDVRSFRDELRIYNRELKTDSINQEREEEIIPIKFFFTDQIEDFKSLLRDIKSDVSKEAAHDLLFLRYKSTELSFKYANAAVPPNDLKGHPNESNLGNVYEHATYVLSSKDISFLDEINEKLKSVGQQLYIKYNCGSPEPLSKSQLISKDCYPTTISFYNILISFDSFIRQGLSLQIPSYGVQMAKLFLTTFTTLRPPLKNHTEKRGNKFITNSDERTFSKWVKSFIKNHK